MFKFSIYSSKIELPDNGFLVYSGMADKFAYISKTKFDYAINNNCITNLTELIQNYTIRLHNVSFKYPGANSKNVLININLCINAGETIAIVGESGSGKTTLMKMLMGLYLPSSGKMYINEDVIDETNSDEWHKFCSAVMQDGKIFTGTILSNVGICDSNPNYDRAFEALERSTLSEFINNLPRGIHTRVGVTGVSLSGGQAQRLLIARALYRDTPILFLDEATSSLDAINEHSIIENIRELHDKKTIIIAAHRLSTIRHADIIFYIKDGRIMEHGSHKSLIDKKGLYYQLFQKQENSC